MGIITRTAATKTTPFGGGSAWNNSTLTGGDANVSGSCSSGTSYSSNKGCQWSDFGAPISSIVLIKMKYDWNWGADAFGQVNPSDGFVDTGGSAAGSDFSGGASISLTGPGPVSDTDSGGNSGSANTTLPNNTTLSSLATDAFCNVSGSCGTDGSGNSSASVQISDLKIEVTVSDQNRIVTSFGCGP